MGKPPNWVSTGHESVGEHISLALEPKWGALMFGGGIEYGPADMKTGFQVPLLAKFADPVLEPLLLLDPRGGFFAQADVEAGVRAQCEKVEYKAFVAEAALKATRVLISTSPPLRTRFASCSLTRGRSATSGSA